MIYSLKKKFSIKKAFSHQDVKSSNSNSPFTSNQEVFNLHNRTVSLHDLLQLWNQSYKVRLLKKRDYGKNSGSLLIWFIKMLKTSGQTKKWFHFHQNRFGSLILLQHNVKRFLGSTYYFYFTLYLSDRGSNTTKTNTIWIKNTNIIQAQIQNHLIIGFVCAVVHRLVRIL